MKRTMLHVRPRLFVICVAVAVLALLAAGGALAFPQSAMRIRTDPVVSRPLPGAVQTVTIYLENVEDLRGADFTLRFDPEMLEVEDADPAMMGIQIAGNGTIWQGRAITPEWDATNYTDNTKGVIYYGTSMLGLQAGEKGVDGSGVLATIRFRVKKVGLGTLVFDPTGSGDAEGTHVILGENQVQSPIVSLTGFVAVGTRQIQLPFVLQRH